MIRSLAAILFVSLLGTLLVPRGASLRAEDQAETPVPPSVLPGEGAPLPWTDAAVLGLVEGITEFLPISSTGHLVLANHLLGLERETQARDLEGTPLWKTLPRTDPIDLGTPYTVKTAADTYSIVIQVGAIAAVAILYWRTILGILIGLLGRNPAGLRLLRNLLIAFFPAVIAGLALDDLIDEHLFSTTTVAAALLVGAGIMYAADRWQRGRAARGVERDLELADLSPRQALLIGLLQCFALWPGMSRSMMTIVGGYLAGLRPARAAEFSFLLGLPTLAGAAAYKGWGAGAGVLAAFGTAPVLFGGIVAAVSAALAVKWLVAWLTRHGMSVFAIYRIVLAALVLAFVS